MIIHHYYRKTDPPHSLFPRIQEELKDLGLHTEADKVTAVDTESCFNVQVGTGGNEESVSLTTEEKHKLEWLLKETFDDGLRLETSWLTGGADQKDWIVEFGPRMTFTSAFSSNAVSICQACGIRSIERLELSRRYRFAVTATLSDAAFKTIKSMLHDRMTEQEYTSPITTFDSGARPAPVKIVPIMTEGRAALERINKEMGLGFDDFDLDYYTDLFKEKLGRDPTDVECFDMGQSNSEHSRHWFFGGKMVIDGETKAETLFQMVKATLPKGVPNNSIIAFHDNSSAIRGYECDNLSPTFVDKAGPMKVKGWLVWLRLRPRPPSSPSTESSLISHCEVAKSG